MTAKPIRRVFLTARRRIPSLIAIIGVIGLLLGVLLTRPGATPQPVAATPTAAAAIPPTADAPTPTAPPILATPPTSALPASGVPGSLPTIERQSVFSNLMASSARPNLYGVYELGFDLARSYDEAGRFDPAVVDVRAAFSRPDGTVETIPGFYKQDQAPRWAVRYAPRVPGPYRITLMVADRTGVAMAEAPGFTTAAPQGAGFIGVDGTRLRTSNGEVFVIVGTNAAWSEAQPDGGWDTEYVNQFDSMIEGNMNLARIWASVRWDAHAIEWSNTAHERGEVQAYAGLGRYYLPNAARADRIFANAQARDIYLIWTLASFGDFEYNWADNPYNSANGGPCATTLCFQQSPDAQASWRRYLRYQFARWGAFSALGIVEFWNEGDKASVDSNGAAWLAAMDTYWKGMDVYRRPTTTSFAWKDHYESQKDRYDTWHVLTHLAVTNQHRYYDKADVVDLWLAELRHLVTVGGARPAFFGEFGICSCEDRTAADPQGHYYHDGAWVPFFFGGAAGTNLIWRVDDSFAPHGPTSRGYRAFGAFMRGEGQALPGMAFLPQEAVGENLRVGGYRGADRALLLFRDWGATWRDVATTRENVRHTVTGLTEGKYRIEYWDTMAGTVVAATEGVVANGALALAPPPFQRALAVKISRGPAAPPAPFQPPAPPTPAPRPAATPVTPATPAIPAVPSARPAATSTPAPPPRRPAVTPPTGDGETVIYDGELRGGWANRSWGGTFALADGIFRVQYGIREGRVALLRPQNQPVEGRATLQFYVRGGEGGGQRAIVQVRDQTNTPGAIVELDRYVAGGGIAPGEWRLVSIPLADLGVGGKGFNLIEIRNAAEGAQPAFYIAAISLR